MQIIDIHKAKTDFSKLMDLVLYGHEIIITKTGKPVAKLEPIRQKPPYRLGVLKGEIKISKDFDEALSDDILVEFED